MGCLKVTVLCSRVPLGWSLAHFILNARNGWRRVNGLFSLSSGGGWSGAGGGCPAIGVSVFFVFCCTREGASLTAVLEGSTAAEAGRGGPYSLRWS